MHLQGRWQSLEYLLNRSGNIVGPGFEPGPELLDFLRNDCRVLVVGAGGLGCELLKDLALSGFGNIDVIDMDTIDITNLNRQFLFRPEDVGKSKAHVAAERIMGRVKGVTVTAHHGMIQDKDLEFYQQFHLIVLGLDSLEARRYMNTVACSFLEFEEDGSPILSSIKPIIDGGTEGFKGHARVLIPGVTPCFECTLWLFPPQTKYPLCTLAETPRSAPHCIEYAKLILWPKHWPDVEFDADVEEHMQWVYKAALRRAQEYGIPGVTYQLTQGVVKNIIPAIASTNALVAASCALEALKLVTLCSSGLSNYAMYTGTDGIYTLTSSYERDELCPLCSAGTCIGVPGATTLNDLIQQMLSHPGLGSHLSAPSVSFGTSNLYVRGALEKSTRGNLEKPIIELLGGRRRAMLTINDRQLPGPLRVRVQLDGNCDDTMKLG